MESEFRPTAYRKTAFHRISRLRMPFTYVMALLAIFYAPEKLFLPGLILMALGAIVRVWAAGHVVKRHKLSEGGPYARTRNPLYLGSLLWGTGAFVLIHAWWLLLVFLGGFTLFYGAAIRSEEDYLFGRFGEEFVLYKKSVPALLPRLTPAASVSESRFSWKCVLRNDEHKALAWSSAAALLIFVRAYLR